MIYQTEPTIDEDGIMEAIEATLRDRMVDAAEYHSRVVYDNTPGGGAPPIWEATGAEAKSIRYIIHADGMGYTMVIGEFYSAFHEFGSSHEPARPVLYPATIEALPGIIDILQGNK